VVGSVIFSSRLSPSKSAKVLRLYRFGFKIWAIAKETGLTEREVRSILRKYGIDPIKGLRLKWNNAAESA
jgi:hypothetical protein